MKRIQWLLSIALAVLPSACAMDGAMDADELASSEELEATKAGSATPVAEPIKAALSAATLTLSDAFEGAEVDESASTVTTPKPPWPLTCAGLSGNAVSITFDGPDGGDCTISGTTASCRNGAGDTCVCDLQNELKAGDCKDDGSKDTFMDPLETEGMGL
jgi:hypothetical protein